MNPGPRECSEWDRNICRVTKSRETPSFCACNMSKARVTSPFGSPRCCLDKANIVIVTEVPATVCLF